MPRRTPCREMVSLSQRAALLGLLMVFAVSVGAAEAQSGRGGRPKKPAPTASDQREIALEAAGSTDSRVVAQIREKISDERNARNQQRKLDGLAPLSEPEPDEPRAMVDVAHYGISGYHAQRGPQRFLVFRLLIDNPGSQELAISHDGVTGQIGAEQQSPGDIPPVTQGLNFLYAGQLHSLQQIERFAGLKVPPQGVAAAWLFFPQAGADAEVPTVRLKIRTRRRVLDVDVTESQRALLGLAVEQSGPRGCLAVLSISGLLNTVNVQSLANQLEQSTERKIVRFVIQWADGAPPPDQQLIQWLVSSAMQAGSSRSPGEQFPTFPALIRELHLVHSPQIQFSPSSPYGMANTERRWHESAADAVSAALRTAYLSLPKNELLAEIRQGGTLTRAAAITHGAEQLDARQLPELLHWAQSADPVIQLAAIRALSHFQEPAAVEALLNHARKNVEPTSAAAIESLAGSRFSNAEAGLLRLLREADPSVKQLIMQVLARHPRAKWSETIYEYVTGSPEGMTTEGIKALLLVGHPRLVDVLESAMHGSDLELRRFVFPILAQRDDPRSERLAAEYTFAQLARTPPDNAMSQFLQRTRPPAAIPLLLARFESGPERISVINLLAQIGDESVGDAIVSKYPKLSISEQSVSLQALRTLRHPRFLEFAGQALQSTDLSLIQAATQGLTYDSSVEACRLLISALEQQTNSTALSNICNALSNIGGLEARAALLKARDSNIPERKKMALGALKFLYRHSPGYAYIWPAENHMAQKQWKEALDYYELSLQIDPELPDAYSGRGNVKLRLGKDAEATADFEKAYQLDPYSSASITGLGYARVQAGRIDDGLKIVAAGRDDLKHDPTFLYNSACIYARALEQAEKLADLPDRDQRRAGYRQQALDDLRQSIARGFTDFDWLQQDPDLTCLHNDPDYKKLLGDRPARATDDALDPPVPKDEE